MITKIACSGCNGDLVRYSEQGKKNRLECIPCGIDTFHVFHMKQKEINNFRDKIRVLKDNPKNFDEVISNLGKDFEELFI